MQMNTLAIEAKFTNLATTIKSLPNIAHKPAKTTLSIHVVYQLSNSFTCLHIIERVIIKIIFMQWSCLSQYLLTGIQCECHSHMEI